MSQSQMPATDAAAAIARLEAALQVEREARASAEASDKAKSELLATVSHEVRTPLGAILSMAELLLGTSLDEKQRHFAQTMHQSGRALLSVLNDILDYSKLEAGQVQLESATFDAIELMSSIRAELAVRAGKRGIASSVTLAEEFPARLQGDPVRIRQILNNLVDNALKFTEQGSVRVLAGFGRDADQVVLRFEVRDTGIGLTPDQIGRLFRPYAQADASVSSQYGGTGLGLTIARRLARLMGGDLGCDSKPGSGSTFWFTIRLQEAGIEAQPAGEIPALTDPGPLSGHILVAEDNSVNQLLIGAYLDQFGVTHDVAKDGAEAVEKIARGNYDAVLMDIMMPVMDGLEAARRVRALDTEAARTPLIALTANAMKGDRETYLAAGMDDYVSKPLSAASLFDALSMHLQVRSPDAATA